MKILQDIITEIINPESLVEPFNFKKYIDNVFKFSGIHSLLYTKKYEPIPNKILHLTDTLFDKNGASVSLAYQLKYIQKNNIACDYLICKKDVDPQPHLYVVQPVVKLSKRYVDLNFPNITDIIEIFYREKYDRVICSTEGPMASMALYLKQIFKIPAYFFIHTDWLEYINSNSNFSNKALEQNISLKSFKFLYSQFDKIFVLNTDNRDYLIRKMDISKKKIYLTSYFSIPPLKNIPSLERNKFFPDSDTRAILFLACRLSREKGIFDIPKILKRARKKIPHLKIVIAGAGPDEKKLRKKIDSGAYFLGWVAKEQLAKMYKNLDLFVFPSRFDTFGNVLLEAFSYGMPAISYNSKGPKDIIQHNKNGYLVENWKDMADKIIDFFENAETRKRMRQEAKKRIQYYEEKIVMKKYLKNLGVI